MCQVSRPARNARRRRVRFNESRHYRVESRRARTAAKIAAMRSALLVAIAVATAGAHAASPRAEIQVALCEPVAALERKLDLRPRGAPYETWLFDDDRLALLERGLRLRLRVKGGESELTLKVAKQDCEALAKEAVPKGEGKCEIDVHGDVAAGAVALSRTLDASATRDLLAGKIGVAALLSDAQLRFLRDVAGTWPLPGGLRPLGPIANRVYAAKHYDVDVSTLPDGASYAEIADKVPVERIASERESLVRHLARANVAACADQNGQAAVKMKRLLGK
jgi:hypothetical protein